jgi:hypothetical protein
MTWCHRWYPDLVRLAAYPIEEVRTTDAWVMGQDVSSKGAADAGFHQALLKMLDDPSVMVRGNAALSLVRFGDATGRPQIVALLQPAKVSAPQAGGDHRHKLRAQPSIGRHHCQDRIGRTSRGVRSPISGRLRELSVKTSNRRRR